MGKERAADKYIQSNGVLILYSIYPCEIKYFYNASKKRLDVFVTSSKPNYCLCGFICSPKGVTILL